MMPTRSDNITYTNDVDGMHIIDFNDVESPELLGSLNSTDYPQPGYNHSGWLHDNGWLYVMADETHGTDLKLFDVSDPTDIQFIDTIGPVTRINNISHNPCFQGDLLHVAYYEDGYWLWSVSDPANAQLLGFYDMHSPNPIRFSYKGAWGVYPYLPSGRILSGEMQHGLFVLDIATSRFPLVPCGTRLDRLHVAEPGDREVSIALDLAESSAWPWSVDRRDRSRDAHGHDAELAVEHTLDTRNFAPANGPYAGSVSRRRNRRMDPTTDQDHRTNEPLARRTYELVVGLEVHAQLLTESKAYSSDANAYGDHPNTLVSPVTLGLPGVLPVPNTKVIDHAIRIGLACGCTIAPRMHYARKNYFYPDLPKGYQITQDTTPICTGGKITIKHGGPSTALGVTVLEDGSFEKNIRITRIHMEEDAGKSIHDVDPFNTLVDLNRAGVPWWRS